MEVDGTDYELQLPQLASLALRPSLPSLPFEIYRIAISKLIADRDTFLAICHAPHLAELVHEVEWHEISWDADLFENIQRKISSDLPSTNSEAEDLDGLCSYLVSEAKDVFWLPNATDFGGADLDLVHRTAVAEFKQAFQSALDMLPNLHTFASRPMTSTRAINPDSEYPLDVSHFQAYKGSPEPPQTPNTNDGLFLFLFPAMERSTSTVTRLRWADEYPGLSYFRPMSASALERLESMELCFTPKPLLVSDQSALASIQEACSRAAPTVRRLKICKDHGVPEIAIVNIEQTILGPFASSAHCALRSLSLVSVKLRNSPVLVDIIKSNASSLRHLYLESVTVGGDVLQALANASTLQLSTMQLIDDQADSLICEPALLRYINGSQPEECCHPCYNNDDDTYNYCDEIVRGWAQDDDQEHRFATVNNFDDYFDWAAPRTTKPYCGCDSNTSSIKSDDSIISDDSIAQRSLAGPKWVWGRFFPPHIYCYQVADSHPDSHPTEVWRFISRHGEVAYGPEPLACFEEWDTDAGDVEEPTPYCRALFKFHLNGQEVERRTTTSELGAYLGEASYCWNLIKTQKPPQGAFLYVSKDDPLEYQY
ncbi:hypothetical protein C8A00DRAFT_15317 [Chaetomidium leptoderma]|uniref:Uncharacterized protein n=1 Tax=Chaetomidium leptoderma TaxID=669021 RepID=A0AAN6VLH8_9PEZI|nr:hypothetical protein C8A00DRAFT_15317 [Chaetomidium leptoderma]